MSCPTCKQHTCCCVKRITAVGKKGAPGDPGVQGPPGPAPTAKLNFYEEVISTVNVKDMASPNVYGFPAGYNTLTYTNTSGASKDFIVQVSYDHSCPTDSNIADPENWVDGAIVKTVSAVDTVQYENTDKINIQISLFDGPLVGDTVNISSIAPNNVVTGAGNNVETRFINYIAPKNVAFFKKVTLLNNESVSLKFKTKDGATNSQLLRAQIFVQEL